MSSQQSSFQALSDLFGRSILDVSLIEVRLKVLNY